jgi:predicted negative regulator of RcsB-dependent stress response
MKTLYLIILLGFVGWKGWLAWQRGRRQWTSDMEQYRGLREYLLGNGATAAEARKPFLKRALRRAYRPVLRQWRLWAIIAAVGVLIWIIF